MDGDISALVNARRYAEAIRALEEVIVRQPLSSASWYSLGYCLLESGHFAQASAAFERVLSLDPDNGPARLGLGLAAHQGGNPALARAVLSAVLARDTGNAAAWNVLGLASKALGQYDDAINAFTRAQQLQPDLDVAHSNMGNVQVLLGRYSEARISYERALHIRPGNALTRWNLALAQLFLGDWREGWRNYEARWFTGIPIFTPRPFFERPWWRGESLTGKRLFLHAEQGLGDTLQFCRYVPRLARLASHVTLEVDRTLVGLMQFSMPASVTVMARGEPVPEFDFHCPLLSIPLALGDDWSTGWTDSPYLRSDARRAAAWEQRLPRGPSQWWGVAWSSGISNARRDIPLRQFLDALHGHPGVSSGAIGLLGLQTDVHDSDRLALSACQQLHWVGHHLQDFSETAAALQHCSRVISVDTSLAHLAAGLGHQTDVLLPTTADWRWSPSRGLPAWYWTVRTFRQTTESDWQAPLSQLIATL